MKYIIFLITLIISINLFGGTRKDICMVDRHINDFIARKSKEGYAIFGSGGGMMGNIKQVILHFDLQKKVELPEARRRLVNLAEEFLAEINDDEQLRPYLDNYPFNNSNICFSISFKDDKHHFLQDGIAVAMTSKHFISYHTSPGKEGQLLQTLCEERYEDALQKVREEKAAPKESISPPSS